MNKREERPTCFFSEKIGGSKCMGYGQNLIGVTECDKCKYKAVKNEKQKSKGLRHLAGS